MMTKAPVLPIVDITRIDSNRIDDRLAVAEELDRACNYDHVIAPVVKGEAPRYAPLKCGEHLYNQTAQTFAYLKRRIASGELVLNDAVPLGSFGQRVSV